MSELNISLAEADQIVLNSETWKDLKGSTLKLRDDFDEGLTE